MQTVQLHEYAFQFLIKLLNWLPVRLAKIPANS